MRLRHTLIAFAAFGLLAQPAVSQPAAAPIAAGAHQRLLPLEGGRNFRDLGGYRTADGRTVKWGLLFRSGSMHGLTPADYDYLGRLGIRVVCDFRDNHERAAEPVAWPAAKAPLVLAEDYDMRQGMLPPGDMRSWTGEQARAGLASTYPKMLAMFGGQYRRMFVELLAGHAPLAFNCSAGKDRTGIAAALLLTALGVPRATVIDDYLLTNRYLDAAKMVAGNAKNAPAGNGLAAMPRDVIAAFMTADRSYIEAALAELDRHPGGAEGHLRDEMKLSHADIVRLRQMYLE